MLVASVSFNVISVLGIQTKIEDLTDAPIETKESAGSFSQMEYINYPAPVLLGFDLSCVNSPDSCLDLGQAILGAGSGQTIRARMFNSAEPDTVIVKFFSGNEELPIPTFKTSDSYTPDAFLLKIWYIVGQEIYIETDGGHEGSPQYYVYNMASTDPSNTWAKFDIWELVKDKFPEEQQPPFSIRTDGFTLEVTERGYCCDTVYDTSDPDRVAYRRVYNFTIDNHDPNQITYKLKSESKVPRESNF